MKFATSLFLLFSLTALVSSCASDEPGDNAQETGFDCIDCVAMCVRAPGYPVDHADNVAYFRGTVETQDQLGSHVRLDEQLGGTATTDAQVGGTAIHPSTGLVSPGDEVLIVVANYTDGTTGSYTWGELYNLQQSDVLCPHQGEFPAIPLSEFVDIALSADCETRLEVLGIGSFACPDRA